MSSVHGSERSPRGMEDAAAIGNRLPQINNSGIKDVAKFKAYGLALDEINEQDTDPDKGNAKDEKFKIDYDEQMKNLNMTQTGPMIPGEANATMEVSHLLLLNESQNIDDLPIQNNQEPEESSKYI